MSAPGTPVDALGAQALADLAEQLADLAERAARAAGALVHDGRPHRLEVQSTKTSATDVVTAMDTASEELLRSFLLGERPDDGVLGEEDGLVAGTSGVTWVVDPIDGTVNYLYGLPTYAVSVAAVVGGDVVVRPDGSRRLDPGSWTALAGCVHEPVSGRTWRAARGAGATLDGEPAPGPADVPLAESLVGTGFGYTESRRRSQARVLSGVLPRVRDIRRSGVASVDLCSVASGWLDAYYERGLQPWDHAAGALVATESGAYVAGLRPSDAAGEEFLLAGSARAVTELGAVLRDLDPTREDTGP